MEKELSFVTNDFSGGLNRRADTTKLQQNEYALCVNARTRNNVVEPVFGAQLQSSGLPTGLFQGCYSAGSIVLVFISGYAYYKDYNYPNNNFTRITNFLMDSNVSTIYCEFVPASTVNFARHLATGNNKSISLGADIAQTLQCAVVQDGINQPWIIQSNGTARVSKNYNQWTVDNREYVPIGKQMLHHNGVLYIVSPDGTRIYRSVTGRPLDFVIAVDANANKVGDAEVMSLAVDYGAITCIHSLNTSPSAIYVSTSYRSYMIVPDTNNLIFNEPVFTNVPMFTTGPLNQFSFIELLGDSAFITFSGIRSFNAVLQLKREGKNAPFSLQVSALLDGIVQQSTCAINYDDYAMFFVKTVHGDCVLVYDTIQGTWMAIDKLSGITGIKQFAELKIQGVRKLFFITSSGLYEYGGSTNTEQAGFYVGDFVTGEPKVQHKPTEAHLIFSEPVEKGVVDVTMFSDSMQGTTYIEAVNDSVPVLSSVRSFPFGNSTADRVREIRVDVGREKTAYKIGAYIQWNFNAKLLSTQLLTHTEINNRSLTQVGSPVVTILDILSNGASIRVAGLTTTAIEAAIAAASAAAGVELTGITDNTNNDTSYFIDITKVDTLYIIGYNLGNIDYVTVCGRQIAVTQHYTQINSDGSTVEHLKIIISEEDKAYALAHIDGCELLVHDTTKLPQDPPPPFDHPIYVIPPYHGDNPTGGGCAHILDISSAVIIQGNGVTYYKIGVGDTHNGTFKGLLFTLNPDGTYLFISPLTQGNIDTTKSDSISMVGKSFDFSYITTFEINGVNLCVKGPHTDIFPPPPPGLKDTYTLRGKGIFGPEVTKTVTRVGTTLTWSDGEPGASTLNLHETSPGIYTSIAAIYVLQIPMIYLEGNFGPAATPEGSYAPTGEPADFEYLIVS